MNVSMCVSWVCAMVTAQPEVEGSLTLHQRALGILETAKRANCGTNGPGRCVYGAPIRRHNGDLDKGVHPSDTR